MITPAVIAVHHTIRQHNQDNLSVSSFEEEGPPGHNETDMHHLATSLAMLGLPYPEYVPVKHRRPDEVGHQASTASGAPEKHKRRSTADAIPEMGLKDELSRPHRPGAFPEGLDEWEEHEHAEESKEETVELLKRELQSEEPNRAQKKLRKDVTTHGVQQWIYTNWIKDEIEREEACLELPFTILLLAAFSMLTIRYISQETVTIVERAIVQDITENANFAWAHHFGHKGIDDVNSFADFWSWTRLGLIPLLAPKEPYIYSEGLSLAVPTIPGLPSYNVSALPTRWPMPRHRVKVPARNDYLRYSRIVGGFRFRQTVAVPSEKHCWFPQETATLVRWLGKPCTTTARSDRYLPPDLLATESSLPEQRTEWFLPEHEDHEKLIRRVVDMEDGCTAALSYNRSCLCTSCLQGNPHPWLDELTMRVEISFILYNAQYGLYCVAVVNFWFSRTGHIHKLINIRSSWAGLWVRDLGELGAVLCCGVVWVFSIIFVFHQECLEIQDLLVKKHKPWYLVITDHYINFWNIVDWISLSVATAITVLFILLQWKIAEANEDLAKIVMLDTPASALAEREYMRHVRTFYDTVEVMTSSEWRFRFGCCVYPVILMLRVFKSFDAQPRLAVVTKTFKEAWCDLSHFALVFLSVYLCMTVNAVLFFGQDSTDFTTIDRAFHSCFMAMLGDWNWDEMKKIGLIRAFSWFFTFMLIMVMLLLNMLLAILMEAYSQVKALAENEPSLVHQIQNMARRAQQNRRGERVRLRDIWMALLRFENNNDDELLTSDRIIRPDLLVDVVPNIQMAQALRTLTTSKEAYDLLHHEPLNPSELRDTLERTEQRLDNMVLCSSWLSSKLQLYHEQLRPSEEEEEEGVVGGGPPPLEHDELALQEAVEAVRQMVQERTQELHGGVQAVLGEEMQSLGKRQGQTQRSMSDMRVRLSNLRRLLEKLQQTCQELASLSNSLRDGTVLTQGRTPETICVGSNGSHRNLSHGGLSNRSSRRPIPEQAIAFDPLDPFGLNAG